MAFWFSLRAERGQICQLEGIGVGKQLAGSAGIDDVRITQFRDRIVVSAMRL